MPTHHRSSTRSRQSLQILAKHSTTISFDSFLFVDNLTNNKIILKDARKEYDIKHAHPLPQNKEQQRQLQDLHEYICQLKTTKLFQMDSLRNKIFKSVHSQSNSTCIPDQIRLQAQKRALRQEIEMSITDLSVKQLRDCFEDPKKRVNQQIIGLQSFSGSKLAKSQFLNLIKRIGKTKPEDHTHKEKRIECMTTNEDVEFPGQQQIRQLGKDYLRNTMKKNSSYLIKPKEQKDLYEQLHRACSRYKVKHCPMSAQPTKKGDQSEEGVFKPVNMGCSLNELQKKVKGKHLARDNYSSQQKQILFAVQNNLLFDVEALLTNKSLIHTRNRKGNNLLHLAAKSRNEELFSFLLKRAGPEDLAAKNNLGRTPLDVAKLYGVAKIVQLCQNYSPYSLQSYQ